MDDSRKVQSLKKRYGRTLPPPKGPMGHGPGGPGRRRNMAKGTPKNSRKTVKRLLGYLNEDKARMALAFFLKRFVILGVSSNGETSLE